VCLAAGRSRRRTARLRSFRAACCRAGLALGGLAGCRGGAPPERQPVPVRVQVAQHSRGTGELRYSAAIHPDAQVDLAFKVNGYIDSILQVRGADGRMRHVQDGDLVRRGTVLAHVRDTEYRDRLAEAQAAWTQAKADYERAARMYENSTISKAEYDAAFANAQASQARQNQAAVTLGDCSLGAPMDGTVLRRSGEIGALVAPANPVFVLADTRAVKVVFGVPDVALAAIHMGDTLSVETEALPGRVLRGRVTRIAPSADPNNRVFEAECTIPNADGQLKIGMIAALHLGAEAARAAVTLVPLKAIVRSRDDPQGYAVYVVETAGAKQVSRMRPVQLGDVVGNAIVVTQGLQGGEQVIVTGATLVADEQEVRVVP
jgi:RND family efflux transporter MFP subunit